MKQLPLVLIIAAMFIVGCSGGFPKVGIIPTIRSGTNPQKWEYHCLSYFSPTSDKIKQMIDAFNKAGEQGWELVGFTSGFAVCFKRPLP